MVDEDRGGRRSLAKGVFAGIEQVLRAIDGKEMTKVVNLTGQTTRLTLDGQDAVPSGALRQAARHHS